MDGFITISNSKEAYHLPCDSIVYVAADGNYWTVVMPNGKEWLLTCQLGELEHEMTKQLGINGRNLVRIGKSYIVNLKYLFFINPSKKELILTDGKSFEFKLEASREALSKLKTFLEDSVNIQ